MSIIRFDNKDAIQFLEETPDGYADLILTDPPYLISRDTGFSSCVNGVERFKIEMDFGKWDKKELDLELVVQMFYDKLRKGGTCIIFYDLWKIQELKAAYEKAGFSQIRFVEWVKTNPVPINSKATYLSNAREVAVSAVKGGKSTFHSKYDNGMYHYPIYHGKDRFHPTQKPIDLCVDLINKHSNPGDVVIDTFAGSATTAVACSRTGRNFYGCELDKGYFKKAKKRLVDVKVIPANKAA